MLIADRYSSAVAVVMGPLTDVLERDVGVAEALQRSIVYLFDHRVGLPWLGRTWRRLTLTDPATRDYQKQLNGPVAEAVPGHGSNGARTCRC